MQTANLLDITSLVMGRRFDDDDDFDHETALPEPTEEAALSAIDRVCRRWPQARWVTDDHTGRVVADDINLTLGFQLCDPQAEVLAWLTAARLLGNHST